MLCNACICLRLRLLILGLYTVCIPVLRDIEPCTDVGVQHRLHRRCRLMRRLILFDVCYSTQYVWVPCVAQAQRTFSRLVNSQLTVSHLMARTQTQRRLTHFSLVWRWGRALIHKLNAIHSINVNIIRPHVESQRMHSSEQIMSGALNLPTFVVQNLPKIAVMIIVFSLLWALAWRCDRIYIPFVSIQDESEIDLKKYSGFYPAHVYVSICGCAMFATQILCRHVISISWNNYVVSTPVADIFR